jgi:hypothetical protein
MRVSSAVKLLSVPLLASALAGCGPSVPSEFVGKWQCRGMVYEISGRSITRSGRSPDSGTVRSTGRDGSSTVVGLDGSRMMGSLVLKREGSSMTINGEPCSPA